MNIVITPHISINKTIEILVASPSAPTVFLGGSIEMGKAENWQQKVVAELTDCVILNPRRDDWDSSWVQDPTPQTQFYNQVTWELYCQKNSQFLIYNFVPDTQSPITLLELGLALSGKFPGKKFVCCPKEYFRYGNVKITTEIFSENVLFFHDFDELLASLKTQIWKDNLANNNDWGQVENMLNKPEETENDTNAG